MESRPSPRRDSFELPRIHSIDRVIGVVVGQAARAYPLRILAQHEVVNDQINDQVIAVTDCPLCDPSIVFDRRLEDQPIEFGVSGLLFNSNVLMYDRDDGNREGLWSQLRSQSVLWRAVR